MSKLHPISERWQKKSISANLIEDEGQKKVLEWLDKLYIQISKPFNFLSLINNEKKIYGLYIFGKVGRGKSFIVDAFCEALNQKKLLRIHQYLFMLQIHEHMNEARKNKLRNPIIYAVNKIIKGYRILCIDEFEVLDVADAMIIERVFKEIMKRRIITIFTSNSNPELLYEKGLQRKRFLPFINLLQQYIKVIDIMDGSDYRVKNNPESQYNDYYYAPHSTMLSDLFNFLSANKNFKKSEISLNGRNIFVLKVSEKIVMLDFAEICKKSLSSRDYEMISNNYSWILIENIPVLKSTDRNAAKRFQLLIDILYDKKIGLAVSAFSKPEEIYVKGDGLKEFQRTISRLNEMTDRRWMVNIQKQRLDRTI